MTLLAQKLILKICHLEGQSHQLWIIHLWISRGSARLVIIFTDSARTDSQKIDAIFFPKNLWTLSFTLFLGQNVFLPLHFVYGRFLCLVERTFFQKRSHKRPCSWNGQNFTPSAPNRHSWKKSWLHPSLFVPRCEVWLQPTRHFAAKFFSRILSTNKLKPSKVSYTFNKIFMAFKLDIFYTYIQVSHAELFGWVGKEFLQLFFL